MPDWVNFMLFLTACFGPFWLIKVYQIARSSRWLTVIGMMTHIRHVQGAEDSPSLTVSYEFDNINYVEEVADCGSLDLADETQIGREVVLLVDPSNPRRCIVRNDGRGAFNKSALVAANWFNRIFMVHTSTH
jgi:hypothetical protein